jgi:hypothetical protein
MMKMELELVPIVTPCIGEMEGAGPAGQPELIGSLLPKCMYICLDWILSLVSCSKLADF